MAATAEGVLGIEAGSIQPSGAPDRLIEEPMTLDLGGVTLEVVPVGNARFQYNEPQSCKAAP